MPNVVIMGSVLNGKFTPDSKELFKGAFKSFEGKTCEIVVRAIEKGRSNKQNRYLWGVVYTMLAEFCGDDTNSVHEQMCSMFAKPRIVSNKLQKDVVVAGRTSDMSTVELEEYASRIRVFAITELGVNIPAPNECDF